MLWEKDGVAEVAWLCCSKEKMLSRSHDYAAGRRRRCCRCLVVVLKKGGSRGPQAVLQVLQEEGGVAVISWLLCRSGMALQSSRGTAGAGGRR